MIVYIVKNELINRSSRYRRILHSTYLTCNDRLLHKSWRCDWCFGETINPSILPLQPFRGGKQRPPRDLWM